MAYTQSPGRSPFPQTGRGISPTMMSGSAMKQVKTPTAPTAPTTPKTDIELTVEYDKGKEKLAAARANPVIKAGFEGELGIKVDAATGTATPNLPMHKAVRAGSFMREIDSAGKVVQEVPWNDMSEGGGKAARKLTKYVNDRNYNTTQSQTHNADLYNAIGGGTASDKLSEGQKESLVKLGKATVVPTQQRMKVGAKTPPAKQMKKKKC